MKEGIFMSQRTINVLLTTLGEDRDVLRFFLSEDSILDIDLDSATCQADIKKLFSEILKLSLTEDIELKYTFEEDFPRELYKDVCKEYIKDIDREIYESTQIIRQL